MALGGGFVTRIFSDGLERSRAVLPRQSLAEQIADAADRLPADAHAVGYFHDSPSLQSHFQDVDVQLGQAAQEPG